MLQCGTGAQVHEDARSGDTEDSIRPGEPTTGHTNDEHVDFMVLRPQLTATPHQPSVQTEVTKDKWMEYKCAHGEHKPIFNYEVKKHGDRKEEYDKNCIKITLMLVGVLPYHKIRNQGQTEEKLHNDHGSTGTGGNDRGLLLVMH